MITRISSGSSPAGAVFYNEQKVGKGEADRLAIRNFEGIRVAAQSLTPTMVADKLEHRAALNERIKLPTFHVSLALAKGELVPAQDLLAIADQYMQGMGYGRQPYAVYQHHDTEHPHVHIVSVRVDEIGKKIPDSFERERSNKLRQQIETEFGLQIAEKVGLRPERTELKPVEYGKGDLKADISSVVQGILKDFTFSTFSQFNQLLRIYNVQATEIPLEGQKPGLKYSAIDTNGNQLGAAIKASSLAYRPTRETIERRIGAGKKIKGDRISPLRKAADGQLSQSKNWDDFQQRLSRMGVEVIPHLGKDGNLFGISYIDTKQRIVYTGSELGKLFTAGSLKTAFGAFEPKSQVPVMTPHSVDKSQNWSYSEDTLESQMRRDAMAEFNRNNPYVKPTVKQQEEAKEQNKAFGRDQRERDEFKAERSQGKESQDDQNLMPNGDLIRQLLYALGDTSTMQDGEQDLKKMLRRNRKNRLS